MNKMRDSTGLHSRPPLGPKITIHYEDTPSRNGISVKLTEIFPDECLAIDWYEP